MPLGVVVPLLPLGYQSKHAKRIRRVGVELDRSVCMLACLGEATGTIKRQREHRAELGVVGVELDGLRKLVDRLCGAVELEERDAGEKCHHRIALVHPARTPRGLARERQGLCGASLFQGFIDRVELASAVVESHGRQHSARPLRSVA